MRNRIGRFDIQIKYEDNTFLEEHFDKIEKIDNLFEKLKKKFG